MNEERDISQLLEVDLDEIVEKGKEQSKRKKKLLVVVATIIIIIMGIVGVVAYLQNEATKQEQARQQEITYQEACSYEAAENYDDAIRLFQELEEYKDSKERLENVQFAHELLNSDAYREIEAAVIAMMSLGYSYDISYSYNDKQVVISLHITQTALIKNGIYEQWDSHCELLNLLTESSANLLRDEGFTADCKCSMFCSGSDYKDKEFFTSLNGKTSFDFLN